MRALALSCLLLLTACAGLLPKSEPQQVFAPRLAALETDDWPKVTWQLQVGKPAANRMLDSTRIVVLPAPGQMQFYSGSSWSDSAPEWLHVLIVHAFEDSGSIIGVGSQASGMRGDYLLLLDLRALQAEYRTPSGPPVGVFELGAKLVHPASNRVLASRRFRGEEPATSTSVGDAVAAIEKAMTSQVDALLRWTLETGEANAHGVGPVPGTR
jgi:cholesterol transport system auxiliary component